MSEGPVVGLIGGGAGGLSDVRTHLIAPLLDRDLRVAVTLTPTAYSWLAAADEISNIESLTRFPVRTSPRMPHAVSPHPRVACYAVVPASANTVAKLALGISDNQALTIVNEAMGDRRTPIVVFPRVNAAHARHPAWDDHISTLLRADVDLIYGDDVWP